jgi:hypothetical protein
MNRTHNQTLIDNFAAFLEMGDADQLLHLAAQFQDLHKGVLTRLMALPLENPGMLKDVHNLKSCLSKATDTIERVTHSILSKPRLSALIRGQPLPLPSVDERLVELERELEITRLMLSKIKH